MTATDELRRMLDERGVEWKDFDGEPTWTDDDGRMYYARGEFTFSGPTDKVTVYHLTPEQAIAATLGDSDTTGARQRDAVEVVRCRDCKHGHITINGESCKWCDLIATHDIDGNEPNNGYDPEPYFDADFFCAWGSRADG